MVFFIRFYTFNTSTFKKGFFEQGPIFKANNNKNAMKLLFMILKIKIDPTIKIIVFLKLWVF